MASLLPAEPPPPVPKLDKRSLPPDVRQEIVDLHAQYPAFHPHEIATICFVKFNRKPAPATIKLILASGPKPSTTDRRYARYAEIEEGSERRRTVIRLHANGWNVKSIAGYLEVSRKTVHAILRRFAEEQFAGLPDKYHARKQLRKVDMRDHSRNQKALGKPVDRRVSGECCPGTDGHSALAGHLWALSLEQSQVVSPPDASYRPSKRRDAVETRNEGITIGLWIFAIWICIAWVEAWCTASAS
jgi:hypothetical protein